MSTKPTISVVMPVFNGARYLRQAIASIRWQTFSDWELICVNDGSTDDTGEILEEFSAADKRIRAIHQTNQGVVAARNTCLEHAQAPWIACLDCDDIAMPERLAVQLRYVQENPDLLLVGSDMLCIDAEGAPVRRARYATKHEDIEQALLQGRGDSIAQPSVLMQRDAVLQVGQYRSKYEWVEDTDLWLRLAHVGRLANMSQVLTYYRLHEQSTCWNRRELQRERLQVLSREAHQVRGLPHPAERPEGGSRKKQSSAAGKWARQAARAGYYQTAWKHWRQHFSAEPFSLLTFRVTAEMMARVTLSMLAERPEPIKPLPDWRQWDVSTNPPAEPQGQAA